MDGTNSIEAKPTDLKEGYVLDEAVKYVIVQEQRGPAQPGAFPVCAGGSPGFEEPPRPMVKIVYVYYKDQLGNTLYTQSVTCYENENNIILADPKLIPGNETASMHLTMCRRKP